MPSVRSNGAARCRWSRAPVGRVIARRRAIIRAAASLARPPFGKTARAGAARRGSPRFEQRREVGDGRDSARRDREPEGFGQLEGRVVDARLVEHREKVVFGTCVDALGRTLTRRGWNLPQSSAEGSHLPGIATRGKWPALAERLAVAHVSSPARPCRLFVHFEGRLHAQTSDHDRATADARLRAPGRASSRCSARVSHPLLAVPEPSATQPA